MRAALVAAHPSRKNDRLDTPTPSALSVGQGSLRSGAQARPCGASKARQHAKLRCVLDSLRGRWDGRAHSAAKGAQRVTFLT
jgi:hypothetical protein